MKILFVGEIVAKPGRDVVSEVLPDVIKEYSPDLVLSNVENLVHGRGVRPKEIEEMRQIGIDFFTSGDHVFWFRDTADYIDSLPLVRPANYPEGTPGKGYDIIDLGKNGQVLIINVMGRTSFSQNNSLLNCPFKSVDEILEETKNEDFNAIIVDFHAEATSEKAALGFYLDGQVTAVIGSHTHVPTADGRVLPKGTMFLTDVGMCGAIDSSLGVKVSNAINMFLTALPQRFEWESAGTKAFRSVLLDTHSKTITRIDKTII